MASAKADINFDIDLFEAANRMRATFAPADLHIKGEQLRFLTNAILD